MPLIQNDLNVNLVVARTVNFTVKCNDTWPDFKITFLENNAPMDLTGVSILMQIKKDPADTTAVMELSTDNGALYIGGTSNNEVIFTNPVISLPPGTFYHDMQFSFSPTKIRTYYKGKVTAEGDVSR